MASSFVTLNFKHDGYDITVVGDYYPTLKATRDEPEELQSFEPEAIFINDLDVLGLSLINYPELESLIFAQINKEEEL